ncbi:hypothetical protein CFIO01_09527 [Colletotrichum fioriniae PJ7]|uniref:Uncharacterized protein n=1 Tax=Colletotrichum fioriniae PJ7 TaxID=1445577 RepID=A0A010QR28_9PEZI|nr:hypothetical protein CFIO01_09527 [Colletotrichum fioriniae PJ7]
MKGIYSASKLDDRRVAPKWPDLLHVCRFRRTSEQRHTIIPGSGRKKVAIPTTAVRLLLGCTQTERENLNKQEKPSAKPNGIIGRDGTVQRTKLVAPNPLWGRAGGGLETSLKTGESERDSGFQETIPHLLLPPPRLPPGPQMCRANTPALFATSYSCHTTLSSADVPTQATATAML